MLFYFHLLFHVYMYFETRPETLGLLIELRSFHTESERASDAAMRLTENLEHYIFEWYIHTGVLLHALNPSRQLSLA